MVIRSRVVAVLMAGIFALAAGGNAAFAQAPSPNAAEMKKIGFIAGRWKGGG